MAQIFFNVSISFNIYTFLISPPAFSIALTAVFEKPCASTVTGDLISPSPKIFTRSFLPTKPF